MGSRPRRNQGGTAATSSREAALSAPVSASKSARDRDDAATPGATKPAASAQTTPARMQAGGSQQPVSSLRRSRRLPWEGTLTKEAARRMGLPTEGLPTTHELRAQEESALQQALVESVAAAGLVTAQAPAGPSSAPEAVPAAAPETEAAPEPEAAPAMSDEPAGGEAVALAAPAAVAGPTDAEAVPPQLEGAEPAMRAKRARVSLKELQSLHEDGLELVGSRSRSRAAPAKPSSAQANGNSSAGRNRPQAAPAKPSGVQARAKSAAGRSRSQAASAKLSSKQAKGPSTVDSAPVPNAQAASLAADDKAASRCRAEAGAQAAPEEATTAPAGAELEAPVEAGGPSATPEVAAMPSAADRIPSRAKKVKGKTVPSGKRKAKVAAAVPADGEAVLDTQAPEVASADAGSARPAAEAAAGPPAGNAEQTAGDVAGSSGTATVLGAFAQGGNATRCPRPGSRVGRAELAGLEMLDSAVLGAGRTSRSARNFAGIAPVVPATTVAVGPAAAAASAGAPAAQQLASKPSDGSQSRKRKAVAIDRPVAETEAGEGPTEAEVAAAAAKAPPRKGKKASGKARRAKQGPAGDRKAGPAGAAVAEPAAAVAARPAKRSKGEAAGSQQIADVEMPDAAPTEAAAAAAAAPAEAAPAEAAPAASVASQAVAAPAGGAAELRRGSRRRQQVVLLSPGSTQTNPPAPAPRAAAPAAAAARDWAAAAAAAAATGVAAAEPMQEGVPAPALGVSKAGRLRKASAKASAAREVPLVRQGSARGQGRRSAQPEKPQAEKAQADKAPQAARAAQAEEDFATTTAPMLVAPLEQLVPQVSLQHPQAQPPVQPQAPGSPQGFRPAPSSPSRPSRSAAQAASRAITSQMVAESADLGVKELAVNDIQEPEFEAAGEVEAPSSPKRKGRPRGSGVEAKTAQQLELERWIMEGSQLPCVRQCAQEVLKASNWPCNQEIKLQHLINSPAMHGVELYTGLIKKYGPEQVIKGKVGSDGKVVCGCALCNFGVSQCVSEFEKHGRSGANRPAQNVCLAALSEEADHEISLGMLMVAVNKQRELKSQACFKAGQEGATCEGPAEMHCVWCGVGAHAQCAGLQPNVAPLWICATCQANGRKASSLPKGAPRKKQSATGSVSVKSAPKAGKKRAREEEEDETVGPSGVKPAKKKRKESSGWGRATLLDSRMYPNERVFFGLPGGLEDGERLYYRKTVSSDTILTGRASLRNASNPNSWGVICECKNCKGQAVIKPTKFENCAGNGSAKQPYQHIWVKRGGRLVVLKELSRMLPPLDTEDLQAAYHRASQAKSRSQNVEKVGGCVFCNSTHFTPSTEGRWDEQTAVLCSQCEREHHVGCLRKHRGIHLNEEPPGDWFCSEPCSHMFSQLKGLVTDAPVPIPTHLQPPDRPQYFMSFLNGLSGSHTTKLDVRAGQAVLTEAFASWRCAGFPAQQGEHAPYAATDIPVGGMDPVTSYHSDDLVVHDDGIVECTKKKEAGMVMKNMIMLMPEAASHGAFDFQGFYTLLLTKMEPEMTAKGAPIVGEDGQPRQRRVPLCTLTARFLGPRLVEVPFVATRLKSQRQGHCRILISVLEHMMQQVGVKHIVLPASKSTVATWQGGFGFQPCPEAMYRMYLKEYPILNFVADTVVMHKWTVGAEDADRRADEAAVKESKGKKGKGGRPPLISKSAAGSGGLGPSGPSSAAAFNAAVATQQEHLQDAESNQDGQGSGSASDQARESGNAQPPLPQEDNVEMADASLLPVTDGVAGGASTRGLSGLHSAPDPLLDSWGDAPPSGDSKKRSPDSSNVGDNEDCKTLRITLPTAQLASVR